MIRALPPPRFVVPFLLAMLLAFAVAVQVALIGQRPQNMLLSAAALFRGAYPAERSDTLPGPGVLLSRSYHWSGPATTIVLRPLPAGVTALELEYHNPAAGGIATLSSENGRLGLAPTPMLRRLHAVLPPGAQNVLLEQHGQVAADDTRTLGLILSDARWWTLTTDDPRVLLRSLAGLPLTLAALMTLGVLLRLAWWRLAVVGAIAAAGLACAAWLWPWASGALQPALQIGLVGALIGAGVPLVWRRPTTRLRGVLVGLWLATTVLFWTPRIDSDGVGYYAYLRSAIVDGDLDFANEFDPDLSPLPHTPPLREQRSSAGRVVNLWSVGPALAWAPAGLLAHALSHAGRAIGVDWSADGYSTPYIMLVTFVSALAGLATLLGSFAVAQRFARPGVAALAAATIYCGSNLLYYALWDGGFAHSLSAAATTWFVYASLALWAAPSPRRWLALGMAAGLMILMYWVTALLLVLPLLLIGGQLVRRPEREHLRQAGAGALLASVAAIVCCLPQLLVWRYLYGAWLVTPQGGSFVTPGGFHLAEMLSAAIYGLPWWTPAYFAGLLGCLVLAVRRPEPGLALLATVVIYMVYNAMLPDWHGSGAFGLRRFTVLASVLAAGLAVLFERLPGWRSRGACAGVLVLWSIHMTTRYLTYSIVHDYSDLLRWSRVELLVVSWPEAWKALRVVLAAAWPLRFFRRPDTGGALILAACAGLAVLVLLPALRRSNPANPANPRTRRTRR